jgi:site-specific recombinase XerD
MRQTRAGRTSCVCMEVLTCGIRVPRFRVLSCDQFRWEGARANRGSLRSIHSTLREREKLIVHTTRAYRLDLNRFARFAGVHASVASCDSAILQRYVEHLFSEHHFKESSANRHFASVRSLFRFLEEGGHVRDDAFRGTRIRIRLPKRLPRVLTRANSSRRRVDAPFRTPAAAA